MVYDCCSWTLKRFRRQMRHAASPTKRTVTEIASISWVSIMRSTAAVFSTASSASNPDTTATVAIPAPATRHQKPAALSVSRLFAAPTRSNTTEASNRAGGKSFSAACHSAIDTSRSLLPSQPQVRHGGRIRRVVVKSLPRLLSVHPGEHHPLEERRRRVLPLPVLVEHDFRDPVGRV